MLIINVGEKSGGQRLLRNLGFALRNYFTQTPKEMRDRT